MDPFLCELAGTIRRDRLLPRGRRLLLAVSGGRDSMALLHALVRLRGQFDWQIEVGHFNHGLRGRAADADERLVRRSCARLAVPVHVGHWAPADRERAIRSGGVEDAARHARRAFLGMVAARIGARSVVLAHHVDDQVELFFVRLFRGAAISGLGGMRQRARQGPPVNIWVVRPFLDRRRSEVAAWAAANRIRFREDASNLEMRFLRNRIRFRLLPLLVSEFSEALPGIILRTMRGLADDAAWMRSEAAQFLAGSGATPPAFNDCPPALQRQVLALQLEQQGIRFDRELIEKLRASVAKWIPAPGARIVSRDDRGRVGLRREHTLEFDPAARVIALEATRGEIPFDTARVQWSLVRPRRPLRFGPGREYFDAAAVGNRVTVRHWRRGDRLQPLGMARPVKIQNLFTNARVPADERRRRLVAASADGTIFWVEGLRIGEQFKVTAATRQCLVWRVHRPRPVRK